ncbi:MAG: Uma2 family endonuclease, partial [Desulfobacteraceae bacterium]|nr:Uma2 family endonuclease [Desulfobacteraceae bacterium]
AKNIHSVLQWAIQQRIYELMKQQKRRDGYCPNGSVQTADNVKVADVAWISEERFQQVRHEIAYSLAPEICIEVMSDSNTQREMKKKTGLYLKAGAKEVWICDENGKMRFYNQSGKLKQSVLIPKFPAKIEI